MVCFVRRLAHNTIWYINYVLSCYLKGFLIVFGTFAHKVAHTWFVLHETWHTTLVAIYYCVEVARILNHSHMLEIMC